MVKVITAGRRTRTCVPLLSAFLVVFVMWGLVGTVPTVAQPPAQTKATPPAPQAKTKAGAGAAGKGAAAQPPAQSKDQSATDKAAADTEASRDEKKDEGGEEAPPDPSLTGKVATVEVFRDPIAEEILDLKKFRPISGIRPPLPADVEAVKLMAQEPATPVDQTVIRRVVDGKVAQLTDTRNIQALIDPPPELKPTAPAVRAVEEATTTLLEPLYVARANKSQGFLREYNRALLRSLTPLLKHHLVPRVQAMIVLGQSGNAEAYKLFVDEIKNEKQTVWVKLWAIRGLANILRYNPPGRLTPDQENNAARVIAALLSSNKELPWPVQMRAFETLGVLRQGFVPTSPRDAEMAVVAMRFLTDPKARIEVRAEAARALGMMQITSAVTGYNYLLVGHAFARLAAEIGDQVVASYTDKGTVVNEVKAQHMTSLLIGPIFQAFEGQAGARDSGLLHGNATSRGEIQGLQNQVKPVTQASLDLVRSAGGQLKARRQDVATRVAALKEYLAKHPLANHHLIPDDNGYLEADDKQSAETPAEPGPGAAKVTGAPGAK